MVAKLREEGEINREEGHRGDGARGQHAACGQHSDENAVVEEGGDTGHMFISRNVTNAPTARPIKMYKTISVFFFAVFRCKNSYFSPFFKSFSEKFSERVH